MKKRLKCILLIDDREDCNYMHKLILESMDCVEKVETAMDGMQALDFLGRTQDGIHLKPEIIFLDINMPVMDGWEFLEEFENLNADQKDGTVLIMLSSSVNPKDKERALANKNVKEFMTKYLDETAVKSIFKKYFEEYL